MSTLDRRDFLKVAGAGAGALLTGCASAPGFARSGTSSANIVVIGAGAFGGWTALNLQRLGARVTLVDMFGPGNSRSTSGDETRGVRTSYGDRPHGELWMQWANQAISRWKEWDAEYAKPLKMRVFFPSGDLIMRADWEPFLTQTRTWWQKNGIPHETLPVDEVQKRWPAFQVRDIKAVLYEPNAGIVRARRATEAVAEVFRQEGGRMIIGRVVPPTPGEFDGHTVRLTSGEMITGDAFVFAVGPWLGKTFPLMQNRMRTPLGTVCYFGTPIGDQRFTHPNMPSWNFPGTTGWPGLPVDNRGFRVRGGAGRGGNAGGANTGGSTSTRDANSDDASQAGMADPDFSVRWVEPERLVRPKQFVADRFPALKDAPILQTWACHYESTSSRNFIIDQHPNLRNVWIAGGGNAEAFKMGPVIGEYVAKRVLGDEGDPAIAKQFRIPETEYSPATQRAGDDD
ncbi:MAG: FAD-dependent oxidoreductase [Gemmatimonadaceae bacterium]